jgi:hypothetical protein
MNCKRLDVRIKQLGNVHGKFYDVSINGMSRTCRSPIEMGRFLESFVYDKPIRNKLSSVMKKFWTDKFGENQGKIIEVMFENDRPMKKESIFTDVWNVYGRNFDMPTDYMPKALASLVKRNIVVKTFNDKYKLSKWFMQKRRNYYVVRRGVI